MKYVNVEESNVGTAKVMYTLSLRNQHLSFLRRSCRSY